MKMLTGCLVVVVATSLGGCANMKPLFGYTPAQQKAMKMREQVATMTLKCERAAVLYANLKVPADRRAYSIPGIGDQVCPRMGFFTRT